MVTQFTEVRDYAQYSLDRIHELAASGCVYFYNRSVQHDVDKFGYDFDEVCTCLQLLKASNFERAGRYGDASIWHDVYTLEHQAPAGYVDRLYIKLSLSKSCLVVNIFSFHPSGA